MSLIALGVALYAVRRSNRNSSVATLVTLNDAFRQAWQRYLAAPEPDKDYSFSELANLLEIACGIHCEKSLFGISRELSSEYVEHVLLLIEENNDARARLRAAVHAPNTFKYIARFRANMRRT
ncbi:hypothetical protein [Falsiroseomonas stagni]|uniref:hypothetical protein n=1 Tax=Falsiroseomonas stagni TaxID=484882 RepID=UPI001113CB4A|nr:hypothetical protein [Falsiroseomonas stagni]